MWADRQTNTQIRLSQYCAPLPGRCNNTIQYRRTLRANRNCCLAVNRATIGGREQCGLKAGFEGGDKGLGQFQENSRLRKLCKCDAEWEATARAYWFETMTSLTQGSTDRVRRLDLHLQSQSSYGRCLYTRKWLRSKINPFKR